jgi:cytochrome c
MPPPGKNCQRNARPVIPLTRAGRTRNLWGIVGGARAEADGFSFSSALKDMGGTWSVADLNAFLFKPKQFAPGTKMNFAGFKKPEERAEMVRYLRDMSDSPIPLQ